MIDVALDGKPVEAEFILDGKFFRPTVFEMIQYFVKITLSFSKLTRHQIEQTVVECMITKYYRCHCTKDIVIVADKNIGTLSWRPKNP